MTVEMPKLQPGCIICGNTIPEKKAKFRSLTCSDECAKIRRNARLTPEKYRDLKLYCQVCRGAIPPVTAKKGGVVCSVACRNEMRRYRWAILKMQKCPHCYHPSSPAEWERYRIWRASEGPMQAFVKEPAGRGNLAWKREKQLKNALRAPLPVLRAIRGLIYDERFPEALAALRDQGLIIWCDVAEWDRLIANMESLLESPQKRTVDTEATE